MLSILVEGLVLIYEDTCGVFSRLKDHKKVWITKKNIENEKSNGFLSVLDRSDRALDLSSLRQPSIALELGVNYFLDKMVPIPAESESMYQQDEITAINGNRAICLDVISTLVDDNVMVEKFVEGGIFPLLLEYNSQFIGYEHIYMKILLKLLKKEENIVKMVKETNNIVDSVNRLILINPKLCAFIMAVIMNNPETKEMVMKGISPLDNKKNDVIILTTISELKNNFDNFLIKALASIALPQSKEEKEIWGNVNPVEFLENYITCNGYCNNVFCVFTGFSYMTLRLSYCAYRCGLFLSFPWKRALYEIVKKAGATIIALESLEAVCYTLKYRFPSVKYGDSKLMRIMKKMFFCLSSVVYGTICYTTMLRFPYICSAQIVYETKSDPYTLSSNFNDNVLMWWNKIYYGRKIIKRSKKSEIFNIK